MAPPTGRRLAAIAVAALIVLLGVAAVVINVTDHNWMMLLADVAMMLAAIFGGAIGYYGQPTGEAPPAA